MKSESASWSAIAAGIGLVCALSAVGCGDSKVSKTDGPLLVPTDGATLPLDTPTADALLSTGGAIGSGGILGVGGGLATGGGTSGRGGAGGLSLGGSIGTGAGGVAGLDANSNARDTALGGNGGSGQGAGGNGGATTGSNGGGAGGVAGGNGGTTSDGGVDGGHSIPIDGSPVRDAWVGEDTSIVTDLAADGTAGSNLYLPLCKVGSNGTYFPPNPNQDIPCSIPNSLGICAYDSHYGVWICNDTPCPTGSSGDFPGSTKLMCWTSWYKCLYSDGTLCMCELDGYEARCDHISTWFGKWDAGVRDAPVRRDTSPPVKPACLSDVVTASCDPATQRYCTMPNGRELCECRNGAWACSATGCPATPTSQTTCTSGQDMMCNSTGSNVCICQASGYFLCGSI